VAAKKYLARRLRNEDVDLVIRSEGGKEEVATEISFVSSPKKSPGQAAIALHEELATPYLARQLSDGEIWTTGGVNPCGLVVRRGDRS
jgi:hypothetical protein